MRKQHTTLFGLLVLAFSLGLFPFHCIDGIGLAVSNKSYFVFNGDGSYLAKVFHTEKKTWVRVHETGEMKTIAKWGIENFKPLTIEFSRVDSGKLLLGGRKKLMVYSIKPGGQKLVFLETETRGEGIIQSFFQKNGKEVVWATENAVYKRHLVSGIKKRVAVVNQPYQTIRSVSGLTGDRYAVSVKGSDTVLIYSADRPNDPEKLREHQAPVVGVESSDGDTLYSLDQSRELIIWDVPQRQALNRLTLAENSDTKVLGVKLDNSGKNLLVLYRDGEGKVGRKYALSDLARGVVQPVEQPVAMTQSGNIYSAVESGAVEMDEYHSPSVPEVSFGEVAEAEANTRSDGYEESEGGNTLYQLAKIEADNENFEAALDLIKRMSLSDPEYRKSRELRRRVLTEIELRNSVDAAVSQYQQGNYKSARIILERINARNPNNRTVTRYLRLVEDKLSDDFLIRLLMFILILSVLAMISLLLWRYQDTIRERVGRSASPKTIRRDRPKDAGKKGRDSSDSRREFVFTLDRVRKQLKRALVLDREQTQKETLLEIAARLTMIEKRAKLDDKRLPELIEQLGRVQEEIAALFPKTKPEERKREAEQRDSEKQHDSSRKRSENKRGSDQHESSTDGPSKKKTTPDYFQILGVGKNVTADELKKAYRQKMREYHPDKHSASDFAWIKEEADRQTKLIREAYDALSDGMK